MNRVAVLNVVGLTARHLGETTPRMSAYALASNRATIEPSVPAVTCTAQANYLTGQLPQEHGIVANGWYQRDLAEVHFWKQSNHVVAAPKIWDELRTIDSSFTCANLFWWFNMYSSVDYSITPRPMYPADGRKLFDIYTWPYGIRPAIKQELGEFPFAAFWGPAAGMQSPQGGPDAVSRWIAGSARWIEQKYSPTLSLVYLPHLDYNLQRLGPGDHEIQNDLHRIDVIVGELLDFYQARGVQVILLSEYGISPVKTPVHLNRVFRERGWITTRDELGRELLDAGNSRAFAVADHQLAHIYVREKALLYEVSAITGSVPGVAQVLDESGKRGHGLNHPRAGDLVAISREDAWFTYYYWLDDNRAPDFARTVDIHRKPGYDPVELFLDPALRFPKARIARRLLQKKLGFRMLMDVIPLDAGLVRGSHGARPADRADWPLIIQPRSMPAEIIRPTDVYGMIREAVCGTDLKPLGSSAR